MSDVIIREPIEEIMRFLRILIALNLCQPEDEIDFEQPLLELGADSIVMSTALATIQKKYGVTIRMLQLFEEIPDIQSIATFIDEKINHD